MKKQFTVIIIAITIILAGAAGFGGAYLANSIVNITPPASVYTLLPDEETALARGIGQEDASIEDNLSYVTPSEDGAGFAFLAKESAKPSSEQLTIPEIAAFASDSIVEIYTESVINSGRMGQFVTEGAGSGIIISADGYIVTNNHVIEGSRKITVRLSNGVDYEATLIGRDSKTDLAVLRIKATGLQSVVFGNSDILVAGELAVAIGNPLGKLGGTVTEGIISALSRSIEIDGHMMTLLQTTAAVNPGNSGGGLFNSYGELIGVVNAKSSGTGIEGIGFAIPVNLAKTIAEALIEHGYVPGRLDFGATLINILDPITAMRNRVQTTGVYVSQVASGGTLQVGDRIISINGTSVGSITDVNELLESYTVGDVLSIVVSRNGNTVTVGHTLLQAMS